MCPRCRRFRWFPHLEGRLWIAVRDEVRDEGGFHGTRQTSERNRNDDNHYVRGVDNNLLEVKGANTGTGEVLHERSVSLRLEL